ncbi:hypothetical protein HDU84_001472 [Entophlyctis sp. JEL0112]|nr:hypothetical protein HDU84_001472 [Entophlyctis sp. JEL0112]
MTTEMTALSSSQHLPSPQAPSTLRGSGKKMSLTLAGAGSLTRRRSSASLAASVSTHTRAPTPLGALKILLQSIPTPVSGGMLKQQLIRLRGEDGTLDAEFDQSVAENLLAHDLVIVILAFLHPRDALRLRRVSRAFNEILTSRSFALACMANNFPCIQATGVQATLFDGIEPQKTSARCTTTELDRLWFVLPEHFQAFCWPTLSTVEELRWSFTKLSPTAHIPATIGNLATLTNIDFGWCKLTGNIPVELGSLSRLKTLALNNNSLTGSIPSEIGNLTCLVSLNLSTNLLGSTVPLEIGLLKKLEYLNLSHNFLNGSIPSTLGDLRNLQVLDLSFNCLQSTIPACIGKLWQLSVLSLEHNELSGCVPKELEELQNLDELTIANNKLRSPLPLGLRRFTRLYDRLMMVRPRLALFNGSGDEGGIEVDGSFE